MPVYLDNNATTPLDERVLEEMLPYMREHYGNASSPHAFGAQARAAVDLARRRLANAIGAEGEGIIFTSGATESNNLALLGRLAPGDHLITAATEHESVAEVARYAERAGVRLTVLGVDGYGIVDPGALEAALTPDTALVSIMMANNETGTINRVEELARVAHARGVPFHTDAAQAFGKVELDVGRLGVDLMSLSAHKCYGPKGVGALYVRGHRLEPILRGGGQERGMRSGTLNVPGIVGFGRAAELAAESLPAEPRRLEELRDRLHSLLEARVPGMGLNGHPTRRLPNTLNVSIPGVRAADLLAGLCGVAASSGSACASERGEPSHVLQAMGLDAPAALSSIRLCTGRFTTSEEVGTAAREISSLANSLTSARS